MNDFFEVRIPISEDHPLGLKDISDYFNRLEKFFANYSIDVEICNARVGSFIPKIRQSFKKYNLISIVSVLTDIMEVLDKLENGDAVSDNEMKFIQPVIAINSTVNISNFMYNTKNYDTSSIDSKFDLKNDDISSEVKSDIFKIYESQILVFTKIDTNGNNNCSGIIKDLNGSKKKITFASIDIKNKFVDTMEPFKKSYLVDVKVYYNSNNTIAKYEILNLIDVDDINKDK